MYKDDLLIPSKPLAVALAEEWEAQGQIMDIRKLHINNMIAKGIRAMHDITLMAYMQEELQKILENDQICFVEPESCQDGLGGAQEEVDALREAQLKHFDPLFKILS